MDVLGRQDLPFSQSLLEFQRIFPDDAACAAYLEKARWNEGFACPRCVVVGGPFRFEARPAALVDRLLHHAVVIHIEGNSYRLRAHRNLMPENLAPSQNTQQNPPRKRRGRPRKDQA